MRLPQIRNILLSLFVVSFFFFPKLQTIFISACFVTVLLDKSFYPEFRKIYQNKVAMLMVLYFLIILGSFFYTINIQEGLKSIETKFSFLVFPLFLPFVFPRASKRDWVLKSFWISGFGYAVCSIFSAFLGYISTGSTSSFFYVELGVGFFQEGSFIHPTYASFFYNILVAYLAIMLLNANPKAKYKWFVLLSLLLFVVFILLLSSKFGILALVVNLLLLLVYFIHKSKKIGLALIVLGLSVIVGSVAIMNTPLKGRFVSAYTEMTNPTGGSNSTRSRLDVWKVTTEVIAENPILGTGTGDIRDELMAKYRQQGYDKYNEKAYDSHQQFLQTYGALGLLGIFTLLGMFVGFFVQAFRTRNYLLLIFGVLFFMFGMIESMLERQAGVVFFVFFGLFLYSYNPANKEI